MVILKSNVFSCKFSVSNVSKLTLFTVSLYYEVKNLVFLLETAVIKVGRYYRAKRSSSLEVQKMKKKFSSLPKGRKR